MNARESVRSACSIADLSIRRPARRRLDVDDRVGDLRVPRHQPILDDVREVVRVGEPHVRRQPDVQVEEHVVGRAARADVMAAEHARHAHHDALEIGVGDDDAIAEDAGRGARNLIAGVADEAGDDQRRERIEDRHAEPRADERGDHRQRRPDVAARLHRVGQQHFAAEPLRLARLVARPRTRLTATVTIITTKLGDRDLERRARVRSGG